MAELQDRVDAATVKAAFHSQFGSEPEIVVRAPGRVNLIGEHTDYNDGFVLPLAINRAVWIALRPRSDALVHIYSLEFGSLGKFDLHNMQPTGEGWLEYVKGVAWALQSAGYSLKGWDGAMAGDVPLGAGLSSSAAVELATARAFAAVSGLPWEAGQMARLGQQAENRWVGMNCGIMDQMISAAGQRDYALLIDCRTLATQQVPLPTGTAVVIMDTNTRRGLVDSAYNERRAQCEAAAEFFGVAALRDVDRREFEARASELDPLTRRRARHVITENQRTLEAAAAMQRDDAAALGKLMIASHASLRNDFEVSSPALDRMVDCALAHPACYGARMTGAGFGGCAVALVRADQTEAFSDAVRACYTSAGDHVATLYVTGATQGAEVVERIN